MKTIKIAKVPGIVREVACEDNATLRDALDIYAAEYAEAVDNYDLRTADGTTDVTIIPADGTKVYLVAKVKGN
jgi:hypothetical protein